MKEPAQQVEENCEGRQSSTKQALDELKKIIETDLQRRKEQAEKGLDGLTFFIYRTLLDKGFKNAEDITKHIKKEFVNQLNWQKVRNSSGN